MHCDFCHQPIPKARPGQRFHGYPRQCRQYWHRLTGLVTSIRQLKSGRWSMTIHCQSLPAVKRGARIRVSDLLNPRPNGA
jgi:hypothetical protein